MTITPAQMEAAVSLARWWQIAPEHSLGGQRAAQVLGAALLHATEQLTNVNASLAHSLAEHNRRNDEADDAGVEDRRTGILVGRVTGRMDAEEQIAAFVSDCMNNDSPTEWRGIPKRIREGEWRPEMGKCRHCKKVVPLDCNCCALCADERGP